jgi:hypothetical protein
MVDPLQVLLWAAIAIWVVTLLLSVGLLVIGGVVIVLRRRKRY